MAAKTVAAFLAGALVNGKYVSRSIFHVDPSAG